MIHPPTASGRTPEVVWWYSIGMKPIFFSTPDDFRTWLKKNADNKTEIWVGFYKKNSGKSGMNYDQALDEALCFGWIDGLVKRYNEEAYMQRFTPRRPKSVWSKINTGHIERLIKEGKMTPLGLAAVDAAKKDGRWQQAYDSPSQIKIPEDFLKELDKNKKAKEFFATLNRANIYYIGYNLQSAKKEETRTRRIHKILEKLTKREKFY